jgi:hypothetical protein
MIQELKTKDEFREAMKRHGPIVITDSTGNRLHATPWSCEHVIEDHFMTKVVVNGGKSGGCFAVTDFNEAQERWPSVVRCE